MRPVVRAPRCPKCNAEPMLVISVKQAYCGTNGCRVFCWDMTEDPAEFDARATEIDLTPMGSRGEAE